MRAAPALRRFIGPFELIHEQAGPKLLGWARRGIFALWLVKLLLDPLSRLASFPHELLIPAGLVGLLPPNGREFLFSATGLNALWWLCVAAVLASLTNRFFAVFASAAALLLTIYSTVIRSFGPAVHTDIVLLLAVYALALFSWADVVESRRAESKSTAWCSFPLVTIVLLLCLSYCLVGINRLCVGGGQLFVGHTMETWAVDASLRGYYFNTNIGWHLPQWPAAVFMLKAGLPVITLFEITAPLCLVLPHYRWIFIPTMLSFHLLSLLLMNIFFFDDMLLYLLLVDWSKRFGSLRQLSGAGPLEASSATPVP
jgi:hypothetical protein